MKPINETYSIGVHVWISSQKGHFLGLGRVHLLENIRDTGSITLAAKAMKMSYRQAWQMVQDMNERANSPLVEKKLGGKGGGGAMVTEAGERVIKEFYKVEEKITKLAADLSAKFAV